MNFIVSSGSLLKHLQTISGAISSTTVLPILEDFLFEIEKNQLTVYATDLETTMITRLEITCNESGKIAVPARILLDTLKTLPEHPVKFHVDAKTLAVELTTDSGKYKLTGENPDEFPKIPKADGVSNISIQASALSGAITKTIFAVSNDELRPQMTGVLFQLDDKGMTFVSTDAHKLVKLHRADVKSQKAQQFIVPKKALGLLKSSLPSGEISVDVSFNKSNAFFQYKDTQLICRLIDAQYPDYNAVIPLNNPNKLSLDRLEFLNSLRRIMIYSNKTTYQVVLNITGSELKVSAQDLDFSNEAHERLSCAYEGEDMDIAFNAKFLVEMLGVIDAQDIEIELSQPSRAGVLRPTDKAEHEDLMMLVMPVMINV
jgi:DNA polymerase-3 subunit beta